MMRLILPGLIRELTLAQDRQHHLFFRPLHQNCLHGVDGKLATKNMVWMNLNHVAQTHGPATWPWPVT